MEKNEPIRIAQIMGKWVGGGLEAVVMNYYRNLDKAKIQFDFFFDEDSIDIPYDEIERLGGKVIIIPPYQKIIKYHKELKRMLKEGQYKIVHSHLNTLSVFSLYAAKRARVPIRIAHSHSTTNKKEWKKNIIKLILRPLIKLVATDYMACTEHSGRWMFGNDEFDKGRVYLLNNAIDIDKFLYDESMRQSKRKELKLNNKVVIGHVGRFVEQKNHRFLISIFNKIHKQNPNTVLMLVGQGPLQEEIKETAKRLRIDDAVLFMNQRKDVNELYQAMDLLLFPSLYEGLGMTMIEAQCSGLPCVASTEVPFVAKINNNVEFVDLNKSDEEWLNIIKKNIQIKNRVSDYKKIKEAGYSIKDEANKLEKEYYILLNKV